MFVVDHSFVSLVHCFITHFARFSLSPLFVYCICVFNISHIVVGFYPAMISHQLHSTHITGYYEYLSRIRQRVNVAPHEASDNEDTTSQTTLITSPSVALVMNNDNTASVNNSSNGDNLQQQSASFIDKDVTKWSSNEVYQWVEEQCQKFELKKATTEKFQMNGTTCIL